MLKKKNKLLFLVKYLLLHSGQMNSAQIIQVVHLFVVMLL